MQENQEIEEKEIQTVNVEELFLGAQESYSDAQQRAIEENKMFAKTEFFRMDKFGTYRLRILPIAPNNDGVPTRTGYEFPVRQMLLELEKPSTTTKVALMYVTVPRATDAGYSVDLIDTYRKLAIAKAEEDGDDKLSEKIGGGSFGGGLKYNYGHVMYIFDLNERAKGLQLLTLSHSQFKDLDERKFKLWQKKLLKNSSYPCPVSSIHNAYPVEIEKKKNGAKTEYVFGIDNESDNDTLSNEELTTLLNAPRIPEIVYRYSRYHFEATLEFLKQCDLKYEMEISQNSEMIEAIENLRSELPGEDKSTFSFDKRSKDNKTESENGTGAISLDDLFIKLEELEDKGLSDKTEEGQELRGLIRAYIEQDKLAIRVTRSTTNRSLLEQIEEDMQNPKSEEDPEEEPEEESNESNEENQPRRRR